MPDPPRVLRALALIVLAVSVARLPIFALLDPHLVARGSEGGDLAAMLAAHHWLRDAVGLEPIPAALLRYKPPLYYVGVPLLFAGAPRFLWLHVLSVNAVAFAVTGSATAWTAKRLGGATSASLAVLLLCLFPGVPGRFTFAGVEPLQTALLALVLALSVDLLLDGGSTRRALALGAVCGAGMLAKWTFAFPLIGPAILAALVIRDRPRARRLLLAFGLALALFLAWAVPFLDPGELAHNAPLEAIDDVWGDLWSTIGWWMTSGLGAPWGLALLCVAALPAVGAARGGRWSGLRLIVSTDAPWVSVQTPPRPSKPGSVEPRTAAILLLLSSCASLVAVHLLIPHKEVRYFLPMTAPLAVAAGVGLGAVWQAGRPGRWLVGAGLAGLACMLLVFEPAEERRLSAEVRVGAVSRLAPKTAPGLPAERFEVPCLRRGTRVGTSTPSVRSSPAGVANTLAWWLHQRGPARIAWSGDSPLDDLDPGQLEGVDLVVLNREPQSVERNLLRDRGFVLEATAPWPVGEGELLRFWCRSDAARGPLGEGPQPPAEPLKSP